MRDFIRIKDTRIRVSCIKKYGMVDGNLKVYYSPSRKNPDSETFKFNSKRMLNKALVNLDAVFII